MRTIQSWAVIRTRQLTALSMIGPIEQPRSIAARSENAYWMHALRLFELNTTALILKEPGAAR
jgi:hypothetical protein